MTRSTVSSPDDAEVGWKNIRENATNKDMRMVAVLAYHRGLSIHEVARRCNMTPKNLKSSLLADKPQSKTICAIRAAVGLRGEGDPEVVRAEADIATTYVALMLDAHESSTEDLELMYGAFDAVFSAARDNTVRTQQKFSNRDISDAELDELFETLKRQEAVVLCAGRFYTLVRNAISKATAELEALATPRIHQDLDH